MRENETECARGPEMESRLQTCLATRGRNRIAGRQASSIDLTLRKARDAGQRGDKTGTQKKEASRRRRLKRIRLTDACVTA